MIRMKFLLPLLLGSFIFCSMLFTTNNFIEKDSNNNKDNFEINEDLRTSAADGYEPNDDINEAYDLTANERTWLNTINGYAYTNDADDDWYEIYVDSG